MPGTKDAATKSAAKELLERKLSGEGPHAPRALDHLALAILVANGADIAVALSAVECVRGNFVDWNEVRVARWQELVRCLGDIPGGEQSGRDIREEYNAFFEKRGALNYDLLASAKPSDARKQLAQLLPRLGKGAIAYLLYEFCPGAPLPLSDGGLKSARRDGIAGKAVDKAQLARVLADSLSLAEASLLLQYWELEATGSPYGEPLKKESAGKNKKKGKK